MTTAAMFPCFRCKIPFYRSYST